MFLMMTHGINNGGITNREDQISNSMYFIPQVPNLILKLYFDTNNTILDEGFNRQNDGFAVVS